MIKFVFTYILRLFSDLSKLFNHNNIFINGYFVRDKRGLVLNNNWGDDINITFLHDISNLNVLVKNTSALYRRLPLKAYNCIGSLIGHYTDRNSRIWGSGIISEDMPIPHKPVKVFSVRGPLTREVLLKNHIECPEIYGDPALLVSRYYRPRVRKKYAIGIIPHVTDENNPALVEFCKHHPEVLIIRMRGYDHWHDIPDQILACKKIISSSLHGLIISDSYGVPNAWAKFSDDIVGGNFKYLDYFASVGRTTKTPHMILSANDVEDTISNGFFELAKDIDYFSIFESCPFKRTLIKYWESTPKLPQYKTPYDKDSNYYSSEYINTPEELDKCIIALEAVETGLLFRGVNDAKFKMFSSSQRHWLQNTDIVYRIGEHDYYEFIQKLAIQLKALKDVQNYVAAQNISNNDMFCLAMLQHFGAPSPMLDFSHSMRKSLFFAVDGLQWDGIETGGMEDYISLYYIHKNVDWVSTTCQKVMESGAINLENKIVGFRANNPNVSVNCSEELEKIRNLTFNQFKPGNSPHCISFLPLGRPAEGRVNISIPSLGFNCDYIIINDRLLAQDGMFIMNNTIDTPLVELMNAKTADKHFCCLNIHKKLVPYIIEKYLAPLNINHSSVYCESDPIVDSLQKSINKI